MRVIISNKIEKYLIKQYKGDRDGIMLIRLFINTLENSDDPTKLKNAKKMQGAWKDYGNFWRWKVGDYRILGEIKAEILEIHIIKIGQRENFYK